MPRFPRAYIKTSYFHVITQGINKSFIFDDVSDIKYYISLMYKLKEEFQLKILSYCIMNNHTHMLLKVEEIKEMSKYMQKLNSKYARYYNKKYSRVGYVFRDRFKAEGIYSEKHLNNCIKYIYDNPVKAGICKKAKDYPYSNYKKISNEYEDEYVFIDIDEEPKKRCKDVINEYLCENKLNLINLKDNENKLRDLIILLKNQYNISLRKIAEEIGIDREKVRLIYKN